MGAFAGVITLNGRTPSRRYEAALTSIIERSGSRRAFLQRSDRALFAQCEPASPPSRGILFASDSRLDNCEELASFLGMSPSGPDSTLISRALETRGADGIARLLGSFVFAYWNEQTSTLRMARDCIGMRKALFFHRGADFIAFATHLNDLTAIPEVPRAIDERMIVSLLTLETAELDTTIYRGICRVPSRRLVTITPAAITIVPYWEPAIGRVPPFKRDQDYIERARELFERSVSRSVRDLPRVAVYMSGGLDSSAVAATAVRLESCEVTGYTGLPPDDLKLDLRGWYLSERPKVEALARLYPSLRVRFIVPSGVHPLLKDSALAFARQGMPDRSPTGRAWFRFINDAILADGHRTALIGLLGNPGLSWPGRFLLKELARRGRFAALLREAIAGARIRRRRLWRILYDDLLLLDMPRILGRAVSRLQGHDPDDIGYYSLLNPDAIGTLDLHRRWKETGFDPRFGSRGDAVEVRTRMMFDHLQYGRDLMASRQAAEGYEWRDPYADRELLEFCLNVPVTLYRRNGIPRWFARKVFEDRLPPDILNEYLRGAQGPAWFATLDERKSDMASDIERFEASALCRRILDIPRMRRLIDEWPVDAEEAEARASEYRSGLDRAVQVGQFVRWIEGGNA